MTNCGEEGMRLLNLTNPLVSNVVYGRSLSSCGRTRRMTCCPKGGMLDLTKTWLWGEILNIMPGKPSLLSPLQENKQSPLLSIEEIQNGIQSPDGHKQLQVICWIFALFRVLPCFFSSNLILSSGHPVCAKDLEPWEEPSNRRDDQPRDLAQVFEPFVAMASSSSSGSSSSSATATTLCCSSSPPGRWPTSPAALLIRPRQAHFVL